MTIPQSPPLVVVLGPYRSGTSCIAGALHHLGVDMGQTFHEASESCPRGTFEEIALWRICRSTYSEPHARRLAAPERSTRRLRQWIVSRCHRSVAERIGAKHPLLCAMMPELAAAAGDLCVISVERELADSIASLHACDWWGVSAAVCESMQRFLCDKRAEALSETAHLRVDFESVLSEPVLELERLIEYLSLSPTDRQRASAHAFISPKLKHF